MTYVINYTQYKQRLADTMKALRDSGIEKEIVVVNQWDKEELNTDICANAMLDIWKDRIRIIYPVLAGNVNDREIYSFKKFKIGVEAQEIPRWAKARMLSLGEVSVLLKHFHAIASIAESEYSYGLIVEDDVRYDNRNVGLLLENIAEARNIGVDYCDLAGGCGLEPCIDELQHPNTNIAELKIARTRTTAAYLVSSRFAKVIANKFLPLVFPVDWHIQYIMSTCSDIKCGWAIKPVLIHGSEAGLTKSWRSA